MDVQLTPRSSSERARFRRSLQVSMDALRIVPPKENA